MVNPCYREKVQLVRTMTLWLRVRRATTSRRSKPHETTWCFKGRCPLYDAPKFGLQTGLFTDSLNHTWQAWETLEVGGVIVNDTPNTRFDSMPYGESKPADLVAKESSTQSMK